MIRSAFTSVLYSRAIQINLTGELRKLTRVNMSVRKMSSDVDAQFQEAKKALEKLKQDPGNEAKLKIYGLFKQATVGKCNVPKPSMVDFVGKAKWQAWNLLGDMSPDEAKLQYVNLIKGLTGNEGSSSTDAASKPAAPSGEFQSILYAKTDRVATITLNRPNKKNALDLRAYEEIPKALQDADNDPNISFAVMTGAGDFFSSGNDLSNFATMSTGDMSTDAVKGAELLRKYIASYIEFNKPLVGVINGPAVGIAVTILGMFDLVYATDQATFHTPFAALGQSPEGCSSYIFPMLMGPAKANELLMLGRKLNAKEAYERGLVTEVFPQYSFQQEIAARINSMSKLPAKSLQYAKQVFRNSNKDLLNKVNAEECKNLSERWQSQDCLDAVMAFLNKRSKL